MGEGVYADGSPNSKGGVGGLSAHANDNHEMDDDYQADGVEASSSSSEFVGDCPFYGCPFTPQDVHYNTDNIKQALEHLRQIKRTDVVSAVANHRRMTRRKKTTKNVKEMEGSTGTKSSKSALSTAHALELLTTSGDHNSVTLTLIGYKGGALNEQINQDRALVVHPFRIGDEDDNTLLGVFDGHAPRGEIVSEYTKNELPNLLSRRLATVLETANDEQEKEQKTKQVLIDSFVDIDKTAPAEESGGCTCTIVLRQNDKVYFANAGDSRSFLVAYRPSVGVANVLYMSREDKPNLPDERARVEKAGGQVYIPARGTPRVVYHDPRTGAPSGLAMSRSIGDWEAGKLGVIPDPIVDVFDIPTIVQNELNNATVVIDDKGGVSGGSNKIVDDVHIFAVSATDGMMDYLEATDIASVLAKALYDDDGAHPITAAEHLVFAAANAWQQDKHGRYRDDIAIAVSTLRRPAESQTESAAGFAPQ